MTRSTNALKLSRSGILMFLLGAGVLLAPWYAWSSGGMQPGHFVVALAIMLALHRMSPSTYPETLLASYLIYAATRESLQVLATGEVASLLPVLHILFGYFLYVLTRRVLDSYGSLRPLGWWLVGSVGFALVGVFFLGTASVAVGTERAVGTFNNPNQLGYFGVLIASAVFALWVRESMAQKWMLMVLVVCIYLCLLSLSKSAIASVALVPLAYLGMAFRRSSRGIFAWILFALIGLYIISEIGLLGRVYISDFAAYNRIVNTAQEGDSSLVVRGYTVLADAAWWQVLFGLSSQTVADLRGGYEVHSTYMAPVASYGLVGGGLFLLFLTVFNYRFLTRFGVFPYLGAVMPTMLYGIAHNGGRTPLFWIFLGIATALCSRRSIVSASASSRSEIAWS